MIRDRKPRDMSVRAWYGLLGIPLADSDRAWAMAMAVAETLRGESYPCAIYYKVRPTGVHFLLGSTGGGPLGAVAVGPRRWRRTDDLDLCAWLEARWMMWWRSRSR